MLSFIEWVKKYTVPVGSDKDHAPGHPENASDPETNPKKVKCKRGKHEHSPGHPKNAVDPQRKNK